MIRFQVNENGEGFSVERLWRRISSVTDDPSEIESYRLNVMQYGRRVETRFFHNKDALADMTRLERIVAGRLALGEPFELIFILHTMYERNRYTESVSFSREAE